MDKKFDDGGPAFPVELKALDSCGNERTQEQYSGMTLWDYYAADAPKNDGGLCGNYSVEQRIQQIAKNAAIYADAMIAERNKRMKG